MSSAAEVHDHLFFTDHWLSHPSQLNILSLPHICTWIPAGNVFGWKHRYMYTHVGWWRPTSPKYLCGVCFVCSSHLIFMYTSSCTFNLWLWDWNGKKSSLKYFVSVKSLNEVSKIKGLTAHFHLQWLIPTSLPPSPPSPPIHSLLLTILTYKWMWLSQSWSHPLFYHPIPSH